MTSIERTTPPSGLTPVEHVATERANSSVFPAITHTGNCGHEIHIPPKTDE